MPLSKSEQEILNAFQIQLRINPNGNPSYTTTKSVGYYGPTKGLRMYKAAEELVSKGLARVLSSDTMQSGVRTLITISVGPVALPPEKTSPKPKKKLKPPTKKKETKAPRQKPSLPKNTLKTNAHPWEAKLRGKLIACGQSDNEVARGSKISQPTVTRFRTASRSLSFGNAAKLAQYLGFVFSIPR